MTFELPRGVYQTTPGGVFQIKRKVPVDLQDVLRPGKRAIWLKASAKTRDPRSVQAARDHQWRLWDKLIDDARGRRSRAGQVPLDVALIALESWRWWECASAAQLHVEMEAEPRPEARRMDKMSDRELPPLAMFRLEQLSLEHDELEQASRRRLREVGSDSMADLLRLGRLQAAVADPEGWRQIDGFDNELDAALRSAGVTGRLGDDVRTALRSRYVQAALEVLQHRVASRERAKAIVQFVDLRPDAVQVIKRAGAYQPCEGDRTLGELITAFREARIAEHGVESTHRRYAHIFSALEQAFGRDKPVRAITRKDCYKVRDLFRLLPANATKKFRGLSLEAAIDKADELDLEADSPGQMIARIKPKTLETYLHSLSHMFNWSIRESDGWLDENPAVGLGGDRMAQVQRRGFTEGELATIVTALIRERERASWRFWLPLLGNYTGARLGELAQLRRGDVKVEGGVHVLHITRFDETGRLVQDKHLKNQESERWVPIHQDLIDAGFLQFVDEQSPGRLFPDIPERKGGFSHEPSKWFASLLDGLELADPCLVFHSFRHGFRDACDEADIHPDKRRALGGWASPDVADKYGNRSAVRMLFKEITKLRFPSVRAALDLPVTNESG